MLSFTSKVSSEKGFALISTLSIVVLLSLLAVGLLSLSSVSIRNTGLSSSDQAQKNAQLALIEALGQLQKTSGPDMRVTASADLIDPTYPKITGVWRSWEGTDHAPDGQPIIPNYEAKRRASSPSSQTVPSSDGRFMGWLTNKNLTTEDVDAPIGVSTVNEGTGGIDYVKVVQENSVTSPAEYVYLDPTLIQSGGSTQGAYAWAVFGENQKATLQADTEPLPAGRSDADLADWAERIKSYGRASGESVDFDKVDNLFNNEGIYTTQTLEIIQESGGTVNTEFRNFHDVSTHGMGLLTNTATGGWRKDLSLFSEFYDRLPNTGLPTLQLLPYADAVGSSKVDFSAFPERPLLYPWYDYISQHITDPNALWAQVAATRSWTALVNYMTQYKELTSTGSSQLAIPSQITSYHPTFQDFEQWHNEERRHPVIARMQFVLSLNSEQVTANTYRPAILVTPALTLWNPYNVELTVAPPYEIFLRQLGPIRFFFEVNGEPYPPISVQTMMSGNFSGGLFRLQIPEAFTLRPGESRVFGANGISEGANGTLTLTSGFAEQVGFSFNKIKPKENDPNLITEATEEPGDAVFEITSIDFRADVFNNSNLSNVNVNHRLGTWLAVNYNRQNSTPHRAFYNDRDFDQETIDFIFPPINEGLSAVLNEIPNGGIPFATFNIGFRGISPIPFDSSNAHSNTKGMLQAHPFSTYSEMGAAQANRHVPGTGSGHPMNSPLYFTIEEATGWNGTYPIPNVNTANDSAYLVSGYSAGDGVERCIMVEIPITPLQSLSELQHFDITKNRPASPYQFNAIGNSSAHPIFSPDQVTKHNFAQNYGHFANDDSYIMNNLLFDDWFISSIAPEVAPFSATETRGLGAVYEDFLNEEEPLPNRFYKFTEESLGDTTVADEVSRVLTNANDPKEGFPYENVASRLMVKGMFNVNSTSLEAWKALLKHSKQTRVPYLNENGVTVLDDSTGNSPYPRTSIAGESNGLTEEETLTGYAALTDIQIEALAREIITEIRERGPFLSLSEFINRKLEDDTSADSKALAGVLQQALDNLSKSDNDDENPYLALQSLAPDITHTQNDQPPGPTDWEFLEAANGSPLFGIPGWIRQADLLKPLAPLLSARDDTFKIRAYGDTRSPSNPNKILAKAWCEVVIQRTAEFMDSTDSPATRLKDFSEESKEINEMLGRRYKVISFRWLGEDEI